MSGSVLGIGHLDGHQGLGDWRSSKLVLLLERSHAGGQLRWQGRVQGVGQERELELNLGLKLYIKMCWVLNRI